MMSFDHPHLRYKKQTRRERTLTIHLISIEKTVKAVVLIIVGLKLLTLVDQDIHSWASEFVTRHGIDVGNRFVHAALQKLVGVTSGQVITFGAAALIYSVVLLIEAAGLWLQKRWAEYLTAISTALLLPLEIYEIYEKFTWVRVALLLINAFIVWYLATRLRDEKREEEIVSEAAAAEVQIPKVKICGITNLDDARFAFESGADQIGLNFYSKSKRYISPERAREIVKSLPAPRKVIGVFVNESIGRVLEISDRVGLDGIQLHGDEDDRYVRALKEKTKLFIIKAFKVSDNFSATDALDWGMDYPMFDTYSADEAGGTGRTFDWQSFSADIFLWFPRSAYIAGGLTAENVSDAVRLFKPYAVDVASGVESSPGKKDRTKVAEFIRSAKEAI